MSSATDRMQLPDVRNSITLKRQVSKLEYYMTVGFDEDGTPAEVFIKMAKVGSTLSGLTNTICVMISVALQYGAPLDKIIGKLEGMVFEPRDENAKSICDSFANALKEIREALKGQESDVAKTD